MSENKLQQKEIEEKRKEEKSAITYRSISLYDIRTFFK